MFGICRDNVGANKTIVFTQVIELTHQVLSKP